MGALEEIVRKTRRDLGDFGQPFMDTFLGDGTTGEYDLTETNISDYTITKTSGATSAALVEGVDFTMDKVNGTLFLSSALTPLPVGTTLILSGKTYGMFSDAELTEYVKDAFVQHAAGRSVTKRFRSQDGFIRYAEHEMTIDDLPETEIFLVALLTTIEALWVLTTDASTDVDIETADGTHVSRSSRYAQMRNQIDVLTGKYQDLCAQLNVGLHRIEVMHLRRESRTTGRLVPIFAAREYDDNTLPERILPPIDKRNVDDSGVASSAMSGTWL